MFTSSLYPLGLDVSDLSIKFVQLKKNREKIKIQALGKASLPPGLFEDGEIKDKKGLASAIAKAISSPSYGKITTNEVALCLPEAKTFAKLIEIKKPCEDFKAAIEMEMEKYVPLPLSDIYYDWQVMNNDHKRALVLFLAAGKQVIDEYIELASLAKLSIASLENEMVSVCRAVLAEENPKNKPAASQNYGLINVGADSASLAVYSKNTLLFTCSLPICGEEITLKISESLKISRGQAEKIKIISSLNEGYFQKNIKKILSDSINKLIKKNEEAITFYNHHFSNWGAISKMILTGGGANIKGLDAILTNGLGIKTEFGNPLINLGENQKKASSFFNETINLDIEGLSLDEEKTSEIKNKKLSVSQDNKLSFASAIGLALRAILK